MSQIRQLFLDEGINGINEKLEHRVLYTPQKFTELEMGDFFVDALPLLVKTGAETAFIKADNFWKDGDASYVKTRKGVPQNNEELRYNRYNTSLTVYKVLKIDNADGNIVYSAHRYYDTFDETQDDNSYRSPQSNVKKA